MPSLWFSATSRWSIRLRGLGVAVATLVLMVATEPRLAIVWDEGYTLGREARIRWWLQALRDPAGFARTWRPPALELVQRDGLPAPRPEQLDTRAKLFEPAVLAWFWPFAREEPHGHPPFYAIMGLAGDLLAPRWQALPRARLGPMLAFSLTAGVLWAFFASRWGGWPASAAAAAWVFQPNLFANGHYATVDALLSSLWVLALLAFTEAVRTGGPPEPRSPRWGWVVVFGLLAGWAADTKLTGWFLPLPLLAWVAIERDRRGLITLLVGGLVGILTLYAFNPGWWCAPVEGVRRFLVSNLTRGRTIPIPVLFLGRVVMTPNESLPWYNTLLWSLFVTPVGFLMLAIAGAAHAARRFRSRPFGLLALVNWAFLLALRALPHTPGHDGVRQFLPAFGVLAVVAGLGAAWIVEHGGRWGRRLLGVALAEGVVSLAVMMPVPLSYFSPVVGGLPGAVRLGMEPTYFWDALTDEALDWLNRNTPRGGRVRFATFPTSWLYLHAAEVGRLRPEPVPLQVPVACRWYVVQNRPGALQPWDLALIREGHPAFVVRKLGTPLVWIFPDQELQAILASRSSPTSAR